MVRSTLYFAFAFSLLLSGCSRQSRYTIVMEDVNGLQTNAEVVFNGVTVGNVSKIELMKDLRVSVTVKVDKNFTIPRGSYFLIQTPLIGSSKLIVKKSPDSYLATKQDTLFGYIDTTSTRNLITDSTSKKALDKIAEGFHELINAIKKDTIK